MCANCSISLTYHQEFNRLSCHYCGYSRSIPKTCSECDREYIHYVGEGTEKVSEVIEQLFPEAQVARLDRDAVQRKGSYRRILGDFRSRKTDILIGTQMIAKGHDFPNVTLVGVLGADQGLRLEDFRAAERTFQLLTQVSGRAGRGKVPGEVVIQTYYPSHYSLKHSCAQDYQSFSEKELVFRKKFRYPPYVSLANIMISDKQQTKAWEAGKAISESLFHHRNDLGGERSVRILGPSPAAIVKLKTEFRVQILVKTTDRRLFHEVLRRSVADLRAANINLKKVSIDVDPINLL
jgi:primosomal protein N' (replication factor Y)